MGRGGSGSHWGGDETGLTAIGCAVLGCADGWRGRCSGWSSGIGRRGCTWLCGSWCGGGGHAGRYEKVRERGRGLECGEYSERPEGGAGVVSDSCFVGRPDPVNIVAGAHRLACAVGKDGDLSVVTFCAILEEHAVVD